MRLAGTFTAFSLLLAATVPIRAASFTPGEFVTYDQTDLGTNSRLEEPINPEAAAVLENNFNPVFAPFGELLQV